MVLEVRDKLLEEGVVLSVALFERRRANSVWKEAMEDKRRREVRREESVGGGAASLEPLLRAGIVAVESAERDENNRDEFRRFCVPSHEPAALSSSCRRGKAQ